MGFPGAGVGGATGYGVTQITIATIPQKIESHYFTVAQGNILLNRFNHLFDLPLPVYPDTDDLFNRQVPGPYYLYCLTNMF